MKLKALRQTTGSYGNVGPGQVFEVEDPDVAKVLIDAGTAQKVGGASARSDKRSRAKQAQTPARSVKKKSVAKNAASGTKPDRVLSVGNYRGTDEKTGAIKTDDGTAEGNT